MSRQQEGGGAEAKNKLFLLQTYQHLVVLFLITRIRSV